MIIENFLMDQRRAKRLMSDRLGIPINIKAFDLALQHALVVDRYNKAPFAKAFNVHGFGIEVQTDDLHVDYDYSVDGREDGFDEWRIYMHVIGYNPQCWDSGNIVKDAIYDWFKDLVNKKIIVRHDNLYYISAQQVDSAEAATNG